VVLVQISVDRAGIFISTLDEDDAFDREEVITAELTAVTRKRTERVNHVKPRPSFESNIATLQPKSRIPFLN
jgi:hypothetical protein